MVDKPVAKKCVDGVRERIRRSAEAVGLLDRFYPLCKCSVLSLMFFSAFVAPSAQQGFGGTGRLSCILIQGSELFSDCARPMALLGKAINESDRRLVPLVPLGDTDGCVKAPELGPRLGAFSKSSRARAGSCRGR